MHSDFAAKDYFFMGMNMRKMKESKAVEISMAHVCSGTAAQNHI